MLEVAYSNVEMTNTETDLISKTNYNESVLTQDEKTIFIVEDNKINMLLAATLVKQIIPNATIFELENGKEALEKTKELVPDLILMDIQMPIMNGLETCKMINKLLSHF